ncbi:MAG: hypothetical protein WBW48_02245 [Anaerolineae bacterium]
MEGAQALAEATVVLDVLVLKAEMSFFLALVFVEWHLLHLLFSFNLE